MNERFTLNHTLISVTENERVNRKLSVFFDTKLCEQIKWPFSKMKMKNMIKVVEFPAQELVAAANFILDRRENGEKISIPVWRDLPEGQAEAAENVVLIPFLTGKAAAPAVLICPGSRDGHLNMMTDGMASAEKAIEAGCQAFILNYRPESGMEDMARAVRFLRANCKKLGIMADRLVILAFGEACDAARKLKTYSGKIEDVTHRYDDIRPKADEFWLADTEEKSRISDGQWLAEHLNRLAGEAVD